MRLGTGAARRVDQCNIIRAGDFGAAPARHSHYRSYSSAGYRT